MIKVCVSDKGGRLYVKSFIKITAETISAKINGERTQQYCVYPTYLASGKDLMKKGGKFYAVLNKETGMWSTDESDIVPFVDRELTKYCENNDKFYKVDNLYYDVRYKNPVFIKYLDVSATKQLKEFNLWFKDLPPNHNYIPLDTKLTFKSDDVAPEMYRSKRLSYDPIDCDIYAYDLLMSVLYSKEDRKKIEWIVGAVLSGDSIKIEKMLVLYGPPGSGKSTVLDLVKTLTDGYWSGFIASDLVSNANQFATALFKDNPLIAIQDDGSMAKIDSPVINEIISHKDIIVNEKNKQQYTIKSNAVLLLATNDAVDLKSSKSGIVRRLLDTSPSDRKFSIEEYEELKEKIKFEIPGIAYRCMHVYKELGRNYYSSYIPTDMLKRTNSIMDFMTDKLEVYQNSKYIYGATAYKDYKFFCEDSGTTRSISRLEFIEEMKNYFDSFKDPKYIDGRRHRYVFEGVRPWKVLGLTKEEYENGPNYNKSKKVETVHYEVNNWLSFNCTESLLDKLYSDCPAQYSSKEGTPIKAWDDVKTKLKDLDTRKLHWVRLPENVIKMDFDKKDKDGNKSLELNLIEANKFPKTYAEISKSGCGIHLYYIYDGDPNKLFRIYDENIEVKVSTGKNAHRRILTKCNDLPLATLYEGNGLPLKGGKPMVDENVVITEKALRTTIKRCIAKEIHGDTRSNIDWIYEILERAYDSGVIYDVSDMRPDILRFAMHSTHQSEYCVNKLSDMKFKSEFSGDYDGNGYRESDDIIFFDFEVKPNMNLLCWKIHGPDNEVVSVFNPDSDYIANFFGFNNEVKNKVMGYNNKDYDNHIAYAIYNGRTPEEVFNISQAIINKDKDAKFREAKHLSYSDVFDFLPDKISLKKWEIKLGINHKEFEHPWDEPIPEELWNELAEYCKNDVLATEAVFDSKEGQAAWKGRQILCDLANILRGPGSTVNDSTNDLTTKLIVGNDKNPQRYFVYPNLAEEFPGYEYNKDGIDKERYISKEYAKKCKSIYKGYDPSEGGFVYSEPGMYGKSMCFDVASEHPSSIIAENGFGPYTENYKLLLDLRLHIKHKEYDVIRGMFDGALAKYLESDDDAKALSYALKIAINSVYGLTSASFPNRLKDPRNVDNWVAKRGALFMIDLMTSVKEKGYTVIHCKTDSIKVLNPDKELIDYIFDFGKKYGYNFEIEHIFDRLCLLNKSTYVCKYTDDKENGDMAGKWDSVGKQFGRSTDRGTPYVFKTLFSHDPIVFRDTCEARSASTALYLDFNEDLPEGESNRRFIGKTGLFTPVIDGAGGGLLCRKAGEDKYDCVQGTKKPKEKGKLASNYRWYESAVVEQLKMYDKIDYSYYNRLVDEGIDDISKLGDFELFVSDEPIPLPEYYPLKPLPDFMNIPETDEEELPFI